MLSDAPDDRSPRPAPPPDDAAGEENEPEDFASLPPEEEGDELPSRAGATPDAGASPAGPAPGAEVARLPFRCGFVGMAGAPNVGKSSLLNRLIGRKISIMSRLPQTTRHRVCGILTEPEHSPPFQAVFVDMPGVPGRPDDFNRNLVETARDAMAGCDLVLHVRDFRLARGVDDAAVVAILMELGVPVWQVWNKSDISPPLDRDLVEEPPLDYERTFFVSAKTGRGIRTLVKALATRLPEGPAHYPEDDLSDRDLRFLAAEMVREKIFHHLRQEVPYGIATWTEEFVEEEGRPHFVRVMIQTERDAHKAIIIGKGGQMLRKIGETARHAIESLADFPVFLELRVVVRPGWRKDKAELERLGLRSGASRGGHGRRDRRRGR